MCQSTAVHAHAKHQFREKLTYSVLPERGYLSDHAQQHSNSFVNGAAPFASMQYSYTFNVFIDIKCKLPLA
jgi:hypothetical protein